MLRDAVAGDRILRVKIDADSIAFPIRNNNKDGDDDVNDDVVVVPRATAITRFISRVKNQNLKLDQLVFFAQKCALTNGSLVQDQKEYGKYVKSAITQKIERVPRPDFKDVWDLSLIHI